MNDDQLERIVDAVERLADAMMRIAVACETIERVTDEFDRE